VRTARKLLLLRKRAAGDTSPLLTDLVAYWKLDETSGTRFDSAGSNNLADNNTVGFAGGKIGNAASFVAANSENLDGGDILDIGNDSLTVSCWFKTTSPGGELNVTPLVGKPFAGGKQGRYAIALENGKVTVPIQDAPGAGPSRDVMTVETYNDGLWHFAIMVVDHATGVYLYVDNVLEASSLGALAATLNTTDPFLIGFYTGIAAYMDGEIDEVGVWRRALTASEITQLYNSGAGLTYPFV
jgi:hypothetical protein